MKKNLLTIAAMVLCLAACQKNDNTLFLEIDPYNNDAKMHIDSERFAVWDNDDPVWVEGTTYSLQTVGSDKKTAQIHNINLNDYNRVRAVFPGDLVRSGEGDDITIDIPNSQDWFFYALNKIKAPMTGSMDRPGKDEQGKLRFTNLGSVIELHLKNYNKGEEYRKTISKIEIIDENGGKLAGTYNIKYEYPRSYIAPIDGQTYSNAVTVNCNNKEFPAGNHLTLYAAVAPVKNATITINVYDVVNGKKYTLTQEGTTRESSTEFKQNYIHHIEFDFTYAEVVVTDL